MSVDPSLAATWLVARLDRFARQHPEIDVLLETTAARTDLAIRYDDGSFTGLHAVRLFNEDVCPVCSPRLMNEGAHPIRMHTDPAFGGGCETALTHRDIVVPS